MGSRFAVSAENKSPPPGSSDRVHRRRKLSFFGVLIFVVFLAVALYVFALTQLLPPQDVWLASLIPFRGHYGEDLVISGFSYIQLLELSGSASIAGLFLYGYGRSDIAAFRRRVLLALSLPLKVFGTLIAAIVYFETHLLWGELWYGAKFVDIYPQGFPWGNERVASNLCFLHGIDYIPSYGAYCWFLNYDELLLISVASALAGWIISSRYGKSAEEQL